MLGAIAGDVVGSTYEHHRVKRTDFPLFPKGSTFTDDTVMTVAVADAILQGMDYAASLKTWGRRYPHAGYGGRICRMAATGRGHPVQQLGQRRGDAREPNWVCFQ